MQEGARSIAGWTASDPLRILAAACLALPLTVLAGYGWLDWQNIDREARTDIRSQLGALHQHALKVLETHALALDRIEDRMRNGPGDPEALHRFLHDLDRGLEQVTTAFVIGPDARPLGNSVVHPLPPDIRVDDREYWKALSGEHRGLFIGDVIVGRASGARSFPVARALTGADGRFAGVAAVTVDPAYFAAYYRSLAQHEGATFGLYGTGGRILARWPDVPVASGPMYTTEEQRQSRMGRQVGDLFEVRSLVDGRMKIMGYRRLEGYPLTIGYGRDQGALVAQWWRHMAVAGSLAVATAAALLLVTGLARRRTRALRASEARHRAIFEQNADGLFIVEGAPNGPWRVAGANPVLTAMLGGGGPDGAGPPRIDADLLADELDATPDRLGEVVASAAPSRWEAVRAGPDGGRRREVVLTPVLGAEGRVVQILGTARDVTERRAAEARLAETQRMEMLGQLTGGVAHDFNNLLTVIQGSAGLLLRRDLGDARRLVDAIAQSARRGADLTRQLLAFARRQSLKPEAVDLNGRAEVVAELIRRALDAPVELVVELDPAAGAVEVDATQLETAMLNLAINARDAMPEGGRLTLRTGLVDLDWEIEPGQRLKGVFARISLADTGPGMPPEVKSRAFEPFFTTKPPGRGTGLGLSQVYGFARQSGGGVQIDTAPGRGTTVTIVLPRTDRPAAASPERPAPAPRAGRVLLVDDDSAVGGTVAEMLRGLGYRVSLVGDGPAALGRLRGDSFDLMVSDIQLGGPLDGIGLAAEARSLDPGLRVLLVTGSSVAAQRAQAAGLAVLAKPFDPEALAAAVDEAAAGPPPVAALGARPG